MRKFLKLISNLFKSAPVAHVFTDATDLLTADTRVYVMRDGKLYFFNAICEGEIHGICEYNKTQKSLFKLKPNIPALDYLVEINIEQ